MSYKVDWHMILIMVWVGVCVCGALVHAAHMEDRYVRDGMRGTPTHVMVRAWHIANVIHMVHWTIMAMSVLVVPHVVYLMVHMVLRMV